jgi:hypothetical protein
MCINTMSKEKEIFNEEKCMKRKYSASMKKKRKWNNPHSNLSVSNAMCGQ